MPTGRVGSLNSDLVAVGSSPNMHAYIPAMSIDKIRSPTHEYRSAEDLNVVIARSTMLFGTVISEEPVVTASAIEEVGPHSPPKDIVSWPSMKGVPAAAPEQAVRTT